MQKWASMFTYFKKRFQQIIASESSPTRLARATSLGIGIAFSPYLGFQTILIFVLSYLIHANAAITFTVVYLVNNPWTMIPIAAADYLVGQSLVEKILGLNLVIYNPSWMDWVNAKIGHYLVHYLGVSELCFWCFIIGGNILALSAGLMSYPFLVYFYKKVTRKKHS